MRRLIAAAVAAAFAAGCGGSAEPQPERVTVATGGKGGIYAVYGAAYARAISRDLPGYRGASVATSGSVENLLRLRDGRADVALTLGDTALDAVEGREAFGRPVPLRVLAQIYRSYAQVVVPAESPIRALVDLEGKRVSVGSPDSGTMVVAERLLSLARVDSRTGLERRELGVDESARALADGSIDAFFWSGGVPTGALRDLARRMPIRLLALGRWSRELRQRFGGVYQSASIPAGAYPGVTAAVPTVAIPNYVVVAKAMNAPLELHPGAQRFYDRSAR